MLALVITASFMFIVNYLQTLLKGIPLKLTEISVISTKKTFAGIFLDRIVLVPVTTRTFCGLPGKGNFLTVVNSHTPIKLKRDRSGNVPWITSDLREGMRDRDAAKRKAMKSNDLHD